MEPFALPMLPRAYGWPSGKSGEQGSGGDGPPQLLRVRAFSWGLMPMQWIWSQSRSQGPPPGSPHPSSGSLSHLCDSPAFKGCSRYTDVHAHLPLKLGSEITWASLFLFLLLDSTLWLFGPGRAQSRSLKQAQCSVDIGGDLGRQRSCRRHSPGEALLAVLGSSQGPGVGSSGAPASQHG